MQPPSAPPPPARAPSSSDSDGDRSPGAAIVYNPPPMTFLPSDDMNKGTVHAVNTLVGSRRSWKTMPEGKEPVWPPQLEAALIEGLEKYRPNSSVETRTLRRFPKRNRYISDYILRITGKYRTPKQVGSRLQQLRDTCHDPRILDLVCRKEYPPLDLTPQQYPPLSSLLPPVPSMVTALPRHDPPGESPKSPTAQTQTNSSFVGVEQSAHDRTWPRESPSDNPYRAPYLSPAENCPSQSVLDLGVDPSAVRHEQPADAAPPKQEEADAAPPKIQRCTIYVHLPFRLQPVVLTSPTYGVVGLQGTRASDLERLGGPLGEGVEHHVTVDAPRDMSATAPEVAFVSGTLPKNWVSVFTVHIDGTEVHREEAEVHAAPDRLNTYKSYLIPNYWALLCHSYDLTRCVILQDIVARDSGSVVFGLRYLFRDTNAVPTPSTIEQWRQSTTIAGPPSPYDPPPYVHTAAPELPHAQTAPQPHPSAWTGPQLPPGWPEDKVYRTSFHSIQQPQPQHYAKGGFLEGFSVPPPPPDEWQGGAREVYEQGAETQTPATPAAAYAPPYPPPPGQYADYPPAPPPTWAYADPSQVQQWAH
ncbi:hypothetical protein HDZ31DRAFT_30159 [Schizophyllum fasciatum]